jgi:serine/threonine protein phosphatase PrpC
MDKLLYEVAALSDVGVVRLNNEDALFSDCRRGLFLVCDGMGGEQAGEVASGLAVSTISSIVCSNPPRRLDEVDQLFSPIEKQPAPHTHLIRSNVTDAASLSPESQLMKMAIEAANDKIHVASERVEVQRGMGTTVAAVLIESAMATVAHVGDSRVYLLRDNSLKLLTEDHSVGAEQLRAGLSEEAVRQLPYKNFLTRALGPHASVEPEITELCVHDGDSFLLATDGLVGPVSEGEILRILETCPSHEDACQYLIEAAKNNGSTDNITCVLVKVQTSAEPVGVGSGLVDLWQD